MDHMNHGSQQEHERISHKDHETMLHERHEQTVSVSQVRGAPRAASLEPQNHHAMMIADYRRRFWISLVLTIPILLLSPLIQDLLGLSEIFSFNGDMYVVFGLSTIVYFYGGYPFLKGIFSELKEKTPGMMTLIALAITVAYSYSGAVVFGLSGDIFFWELATLIDVMLLGHWLEMRSIIAASSALEELARLMPSEAHRFQPDGSIIDVPLDELKASDKVLVKPGEKIPADGMVVEGITSINEAMLTGESVPVAKEKGNKVIGGSINGDGSITISIEKTGAASYLAQVTELVRQAQDTKSKTQNLANRAALILVLVAIGGGLITFLVWVGIMGQEFVFGLARMVTVMVITCPHALGLAIPLVVAVSTSLSAKNGILIKDRNGFEQARNIQAVLFDKTGTLTLGQFGVTDTIAIDNSMNNDQLLKYAASIELHSEHPIAKGIVSASRESYPVHNFNAIPGKGTRGTVNGKEVMAVSPGYLKENNIPVNDGRIDKLASQGKTVIYVLIEGKLSGAIGLVDIIRPESKQAITELKKMGIKTMMITGDNRLVAQWVANEIGLEEYFAEVLPEKKAEKVREVQSRGIKVAMTGDGVNDAPALAQADVGIAIGAGTDVAVASADVVLVRSNPLDVVSVIKLSRATYRKMVQNLAWATGYNVIAIPLAAGVAYGVGIVLEPAVGAALMALSTIIVAANARFLKVEK
jgi:P-type Cu2+ transporter